MPFITVVPAIRTPYGVDSFDYRVSETTTLQVGDVTRVPFRKRNLPALIIAISDDSAFADRALSVLDTQLLRLGPTAPKLLDATAKRTFCSMPTVFAAWIRRVPVRAKQTTVPPFSYAPSSQIPIMFLYTAQRIQTVIEHARTAKGRVLVLTPWQHRADALAKTLNSSVLHADLADGAAWSAVTSFTEQPSSVLVATRVGGWLASVADVVLIDEPENDDFKQDELSPRMDARWMAEEALRIRPGLRVTMVATTPPIRASLASLDSPSIKPTLTLEPWQRNSRTPISALSPNAVAKLEEALEEKRGVIILHPVHGDRSRLHCRDCNWTMSCPNCGFQLTAETAIARCHRCGQTAALPETCANCAGTDLTAARAGKDRVAMQVHAQYGDRVRVADLPEWHRLSMAKGTLVIVTDASLIGGYVEDIRRRERLVISWRRLAASVANADGELYALGSEASLADARRWLDTEGLSTTWAEEWKERETFAYPPAKRRFKLIIEGEAEDGEKALEITREILGASWTVEGPYAVSFRAKTRKKRCILHLLPSENLQDPTMIHQHLEPLAKVGIIDLDPIAFFS